MTESLIREISIKGEIGNRILRIVFGPHYFLEIHEEKGKLEFILGATQHGFKADASEVNGELEGMINEIKEGHPNNLFD